MFRKVNCLLLSAVAALGSLVSCSSSSHQERQELTVFAAASLAEAMDDMTSHFEEETGIKVTVQLAGSGILARQIISGAPVDLFISANQEWMTAVEKAGPIEQGNIVEFARNRLVVIAKAGYEGRLSSLEDLMQYKAGGIAIGDPDHVPAGIYAKQSLESAGIWDELADNLIRGIDVRAAVAYVEKGEAEVGIVYSTDARVVNDVKVIYEIPPDLHERIRYLAGVLTSGNTAIAHEFLTYIRSPKSMAILEQLGFIEPEE